MHKTTFNDDQNTVLNVQPSKLLRIKSVIQMTGLSRSYIYSLAEQGLFPKSVRLVRGGTGVAWLESEIEEWINTRINERDCGGLKQ